MSKAASCFQSMLIATVAAILTFARPAMADNTAGFIDEGPATYVVRVVAVDRSRRREFIKCMAQKARPVWQQWRSSNYIFAANVFESTAVLKKAAAVPPWSFILLTHLANEVRSNVEQMLLDSDDEIRQCVHQWEGAIQRSEVMQSTVNSNYARERESIRGERPNISAVYTIEHLEVNETNEDRERYKKMMRESVGPAEAVFIARGWDLSFLALETVTVRFKTEEMPAWIKYTSVHTLNEASQKRA